MSNKVNISASILLLLMPTLTNLVEHSGSVIMTLLTLLGIIVFFSRPRIFFNPTEKRIMWVFAAYFIVCLVMRTVHNVFNGTSIFVWDSDHEIRMLTILPIYYLFVNMQLKKWIFWYAIIAGAIFSGIYALFSSVATHFSGRIVGPYNPCLFGYFSVALAFMSLSGYHFFYNKNKKFIFLPIFAFMCGLLAAFFSGTRGSIITIPFLTLIFLVQIKQHLKELNTKILITAIGSVFIVLILLFPHSTLSKRFSIGIKEAAYFVKNYDCVSCIGKNQAHHLRMWIESILIIKDNYVFGVGPKGYREIVNDRINNKEIAPGIERFKTPHNMYLTMMTSYGIFGLITILFFFLFPLSHLVRVIQKYKSHPDAIHTAYCGIALIAGYMLFSMTGMLFIRNMLIAFYVIMLAAVLSIIRPYLVDDPEIKTI